jgi:hypothetical protein
MSLGRYKAKLNLTIAGLLKQLGIENQPYALKGIVYLDGTEPGFPTYTPPAGVRAIEVEVIAAGGGGGGADGQNTTDDGFAGGGGGGGWARAFITSLASSYTYAVGAGGAGGAAGNNAGATGGTSSFTGGGVTIDATGGTGGAGVLSTASNSSLSGIGGVGSLTGISGRIGGGIQGTRSRYLAATNGLCSVAYKGYCPLIGMSGVVAYGSNGSGNLTGSAGSLIGEGGNGAVSSNSTANSAGGAGFKGGIKITEYY